MKKKKPSKAKYGPPRTIHFHADELARLDAAAKRLKVTRSALLRTCMRIALKDEAFLASLKIGTK